MSETTFVDSIVAMEENIPVPAASRVRKSKYPWLTMKPGQSFYVPANGGDVTKLQRSLNASCGGKSEKKFPGLRFIVRQARADKQPVTNSTPADGVRCWRVE